MMGTLSFSNDAQGGGEVPLTLLSWPCLSLGLLVDSVVGSLFVFSWDVIMVVCVCGGGGIGVVCWEFCSYLL